MNIYICVGSSCHLKGSYEIIEGFKDYIKEFRLEAKVNLNASFCLGRCTDGVAIKIDNEFVTGLNSDNMREVFLRKVLKKYE